MDDASTDTQWQTVLVEPTCCSNQHRYTSTWERLFEVASDPYGFITGGDAERAGVNRKYRNDLKRRGVLEHPA